MDAIKYTTLSYGGWGGGPPAEIADKYNIDKMPTVDAQPVVHGKWEWFGGDDDLGVYCHCSVCACGYDEDLIQLLHYCPNCGAKMDGDGDV